MRKLLILIQHQHFASIDFLQDDVAVIIGTMVITPLIGQLLTWRSSADSLYQELRTLYLSKMFFTCSTFSLSGTTTIISPIKHNKTFFKK